MYILSSVTGDVPNESYLFQVERSLICSQAHSTTAVVPVSTSPGSLGRKPVRILFLFCALNMQL